MTANTPETTRGAALLRRALEHPVGKAITKGDTILVRLIFAFASFGWCAYILADTVGFTERHQLVVEYVAPPEKLAVLFAVYGSALLYGVWTGRFNMLLLLIEGYLGLFIWCGVGAADAVSQGAPGPTFFAALVSVLLLGRYPTHNARVRK